MATTATALTCPHGKACGACALLGIEPDSQLRRKYWALARAMKEQEALKDVEVLDCLASPLSSGYRNRAKMAVAMPRKGGVELGYFKAGTREVVDAPQCRVLHPDLLETLRGLRALLLRGRSMPRELRHVDLRCGSDPKRQHLTLVLRSAELPRLPLGDLSEACPDVSGFSANLNPSGGAQVIKGRIEPLWGEREVHVETAGLRLRVSPGSFFQVNLSLLDEIHARMADFLGEGERLVDLYAGVGTHGLALRARFQGVTCVEGTRSSVADAKANLTQNRVRNVNIIGASVERSLKAWVEASGEALVMNPSRAGALPAVLQAIVRSRTQRIAYLSCEPETLARDLVQLRGAGFDIVSVQPIDMMPQTRQVEGLALLQRAESKPSRGKTPGSGKGEAKSGEGPPKKKKRRMRRR